MRSYNININKNVYLSDQSDCKLNDRAGLNQRTICFIFQYIFIFKKI